MAYNTIKVYVYLQRYSNLFKLSFVNRCLFSFI